MLVVTVGAQGSYAFHERKEYFQPAIEVPEVIDTIAPFLTSAWFFTKLGDVNTRTDERIHSDFKSVCFAFPGLPSHRTGIR